jgi:hypothetical protein
MQQNQEILKQFNDCYLKVLTPFQNEIRELTTTYLGLKPGMTYTEDQMIKSYLDLTAAKQMKFDMATLDLMDKIIDNGFGDCLSIIGEEQINHDVFKDLGYGYEIVTKDKVNVKIYTSDIDNKFKAGLISPASIYGDEILGILNHPQKLEWYIKAGSDVYKLNIGLDEYADAIRKVIFNDICEINYILNEAY